ncbi:MAG: YbhB/YbcL family Raf kinase inhibitor-like protein [Patescibacteria group bacterium]|nr:YbhB/YbcL family Raf kinase inhibitor-like protein [Patescibacteria group bacterium]
MDNLLLKSSAFKQNEIIPQKHTCDGDNVNPLLEIRNVPPETKSSVLIVDDPDATRGGVWDHWLIWNINPKTQYIDEDTVPAGAIQGKNSFNNQKYGGPCPPKGSNPHRYMFKLYALDTELNLPEGSTKTELEKAMVGHVLDQTILIGFYSRK